MDCNDEQLFVELQPGDWGQYGIALDAPTDIAMSVGVANQTVSAVIDDGPAMSASPGGPLNLGRLAPGPHGIRIHAGTSPVILGGIEVTPQ